MVTIFKESPCINNFTRLVGRIGNKSKEKQQKELQVSARRATCLNKLNRLEKEINPIKISIV